MSVFSWVIEGFCLSFLRGDPFATPWFAYYFVRRPLKRVHDRRLMDISDYSFWGRHENFSYFCLSATRAASLLPSSCCHLTSKMNMDFLGNSGGEIIAAGGLSYNNSMNRLRRKNSAFIWVSCLDSHGCLLYNTIIKNHLCRRLGLGSNPPAFLFAEVQKGRKNFWLSRRSAKPSTSASSRRDGPTGSWRTPGQVSPPTHFISAWHFVKKNDWFS